MIAIRSGTTPIDLEIDMPAPNMPFTNFPKFKYGDRVKKKSGSGWHGKVVGFYHSSLTQEGYNVESEREPGSVQLYPASALMLDEPIDRSQLPQLQDQ
jgi:hypothetical protein